MLQEKTIQEKTTEEKIIEEKIIEEKIREERKQWKRGELNGEDEGRRMEGDSRREEKGSLEKEE